MSGRGLGNEDPFSRRAAAGSAFIPKSKPPVDDDEDVSDQQKEDASNNASKSDSIVEHGTAVTSVSSTAVEESAPPPPPAREPEGRTQMNARVRVDRMRAIKKYQHQHRTTLQAVVDQMVDEYLERRGLLPPS